MKTVSKTKKTLQMSHVPPRLASTSPKHAKNTTFFPVFFHHPEPRWRGGGGGVEHIFWRVLAWLAFAAGRQKVFPADACGGRRYESLTHRSVALLASH